MGEKKTKKNTHTYINLPILLSNTVVDPGTVMVKFVDTLVALATVLGPGWPHGLARVAHVVDGVVQVLVVSPCCRIANLRFTSDCG